MCKFIPCLETEVVSKVPCNCKFFLINAFANETETRSTFCQLRVKLITTGKYCCALVILGLCLN